MSKKNRNIIIAVIVIIVLIFIMVYSSYKSPFVRQLQGPIEGTDSVLTINGKLCAVSKENHIYTWQWNDLSIWPVVARPEAVVAVPFAEDKIVYIPLNAPPGLTLTDLKGENKLANLALSYGAECKKIKTSSSGKFGMISMFFKEGAEKNWLKLALFDSDLKDLPFVFQKDTKAGKFLLYDFTITNDGNLLAGAGEKDYAWVFITDVKNENILWEKTFPEYGKFTCVEFSPDGKMLFVAEKVRYILAFDTATRQLVNKFVMDESRTLAHQKQNISCIAISPDGEILAADTEPARKVWFWDITTGKKIGIIYASDLTVSGIAFSPDSKYLATGCMVSPEIKIWKVPQFNK
jgi:WD40 repeat protein